MNNYDKAALILNQIISIKNRCEAELKSKYGSEVKIKLSVYGVPYSPQPNIKGIVDFRPDYILCNTGFRSYKEDPRLDDLYIFFL